ncbi:MAG: trypsin-like peptidase domain-containing protein [Candidatus Sungbacteria bacterium]|uniref:Trypsin-like peptidase domain-containing protein n=1 Tax=Candidatus Sungiibacteriota bacterium TaxID=2750080 RepID=A0A932YWM2_9BACT|nr:trypsin-like peptidase domain-containing protein [Candidatus Sungbacteria bacterium]
MTHEEQTIAVVQKSLPAVVSVVVGKDLKALEAKGFPFYGEVPLFGPSEEEIVERLPKTEEGKIRIGGGSGFIVDPAGFVLTNKHVVADPDAQYTVFTPDEEKYTAEVLARDPINDVAILKIDATGLPTISLGDSNKILLGQSVVAVGNALGEFKNTVSTGVVSGLSRFITAMTDLEGHAERLRGLIQTDAAINPGNSGGPLMNLHAEVIGINSAVVFGAQNIGFAIPINKAKKDLEDVRKFGRLRKPFLGVRYILLSKDLQRKLAAPRDYGALVLAEGGGGHAVVKGSAADKAGVRELDIILEINDAPITEKNSIEDMLERASIGERLRLKILRGNKEQNCELALGERHEVK